MKENLNLPATPIAFLQTTLGVLHRCARLLCEQYHTRTEHVPNTYMLETMVAQEVVVVVAGRRRRHMGQRCEKKIQKKGAVVVYPYLFVSFSFQSRTVA